jgi:hypothetical protein
MEIQFRQREAILTDNDLGIATIIKLQTMKIMVMLLAQPTDMAIISSFIFNQIVLLCSRIQHTSFSKGIEYVKSQLPARKATSADTSSVCNPFL